MSLPIRQETNPVFATAVDAIGDGAGPTLEIPFVQRATLYSLQRYSINSNLVPLNQQIDSYDQMVMQREYLSADRLKGANSVGLAFPEHNAIIDAAAQNSPPGFPPHQLIVKANVFLFTEVNRGLVKNRS